MQTVSGLTPGTAYWLSGWVKGSNVVIQPGGSIGANLCLFGTWEHGPDHLSGTFDWQQISFPFVAPASGTIAVGCRLGYWGNITSGKVWFDDVAITSADECRLSQPHTRADGAFEALLIAGPRLTYRLEVSGDLQTWDPIQIITPVHPFVEICDTNSCAFPARFYRAVRTGK